MAAGDPEAISGDLMDGWIVKYRLPEHNEGAPSAGLARVTNDGQQLEPLCTWSAEQRTFVHDEEQDPLDAEGRVLYVYDDVFQSWRQLSRVINPHGEHCEETYLFGEEEPLDDIAVVVRPERSPNDI